MITRPERLRRFLRVGLFLPMALGACAGEMGPAVEEEELALETAGPSDEAPVFVRHVDPAAAREHMAAMKACLAEQGVTMPEGPVRLLVKAPPGVGGRAGAEAGAGPRRKVRFVVEGEKAPAGEPVHVADVSPATHKAFATCLEEVGEPAFDPI